MDEIQESAKTLLNNEQDIKTIAALTGLTVSVAKEAVQMISENPEISRQTKDFLGSQASPDLKAFNAGYETGRKSGHSEGFAKGVATGGVVGTSLVALLIVGIKYLSDKKK